MDDAEFAWLIAQGRHETDAEVTFWRWRCANDPSIVFVSHEEALASVSGVA